LHVGGLYPSAAQWGQHKFPRHVSDIRFAEWQVASKLKVNGLLVAGSAFMSEVGDIYTMVAPVLHYTTRGVKQGLQGFPAELVQLVDHDGQDP
jgi:hypothetical protein